MDLGRFLESKRASILSQAVRNLHRRSLAHYESEGLMLAEQRLEQLYDLLTECSRTRDVRPILEHARHVARERFEHGYPLGEVQIAFNVLEECTWAIILDDVIPDETPEAIGLLSTILGLGKDELAREYVELATRTRVPSLDCTALLTGRI